VATLQGSISILKDVQAIVAEHAKLQQLVPAKDWKAAVPSLLRVANKCAPTHTHARSLGACKQILSKLRCELLLRRR
jgi:hypothetical protein